MGNKVSSVFRQEVPEGGTPRKLPKPRNLAGVAKRPIPISNLTKETEKIISKAFKEAERAIMAKLKSSGVLDKVAKDAAEYMRKGGDRSKVDRPKRPTPKFPFKLDPVGDPVLRGMMSPQAEERLVLVKLFKRKPFKVYASLVETEIDSWMIKVESRIEAMMVGLYEDGAKGGQNMLGVKPSFNLRSPQVLKNLAERANLLTGGFTQDQYDRLRTVVAEDFYLKGRGPLDVAGSLRQEFDWMSKVRSERIARTETLAITSEATHDVHEASGVEFKRWLTTIDGRERESHFEAHGQMQKIGEPFEVGNTKLMYPGDPAGDVEEVANCRCAQIPVVLPDQQFTGQDVWRGDLAPDEFARERVEAAA